MTRYHGAFNVLIVSRKSTKSRSRSTATARSAEFHITCKLLLPTSLFFSDGLAMLLGMWASQ